MKLMTPHVRETAPASGEYVLENNAALWVPIDELPDDTECRGCHKLFPETSADQIDDRPWAQIPQGAAKAPALFCPECVDEFKHG